MFPSLIVLATALGLNGTDRGLFEIRDEAPGADPNRAELVVEVLDDRSEPDELIPLPVRVIVLASDGTHPDGSGRGTYADGRFFADGEFQVVVPPGRTEVHLRGGPNYVPLKGEIEAMAGRRYRIQSRLHRWFAPEESGWYGGDHHVHAQHDARADIRTDLAYTALQARANGLSVVTEAGSHVDYSDIDRLSTSGFLLRHAQELRPGPFVGHLNTPGLSENINKKKYEQLIAQPMPAQAIRAEVHRRGGALIHTHPLTPPHQWHWMGAAELLSDAVLGRCADALDLDGRASELLWFAALNLGNRIAASGSTDAALGRRQTLSPGDRRVYAHAEEFSYASIVEALRKGRTFASNGGPIFPFLKIEGQGPGETIVPDGACSLQVRAEIQSLEPLRSAELYRQGALVQAFDVEGRRGRVLLEGEVPEPGDQAAWYLLRVENEQGQWAITSPVYVEPAQGVPRPFASAMLLEIHNATRFIELRRDFYAHLIVTVAPVEAIESVELLKDGQVLRRFKPEQGDEWPSGKVPVTGIDGEYQPGWIWRLEDGRAVHLQADWPVSESAWYGLRVTTNGGRTLVSDQVFFDADAPNSRTLGLAHLEGRDTRFTHQGYGEEMPLEEIRLPFEGDHWWYPQQSFWRIQATLGGQEYELSGGGNPEASDLFRTEIP